MSTKIEVRKIVVGKVCFVFEKLEKLGNKAHTRLAVFSHTRAIIFKAPLGEMVFLRNCYIFICIFLYQMSFKLNL